MRVTPTFAAIALGRSCRSRPRNGKPSGSWHEGVRNDFEVFYGKVPAAIGRVAVLLASAGVWLSLLACGDGDRTAHLESVSKNQAELLNERERQIETLRETVNSLQAERNEWQRRVEAAEGMRASALDQLVRSYEEMTLAKLRSDLVEAAFVKADHIVDEIREDPDNVKRRAGFVKAFWRDELLSVHRLRTIDDLLALCTAVRVYYIEHGRYPTSGNRNLLAALTSTSKLTKAPFLRPRSEAVSKEGELVDAWGRPYVYVVNQGRDLPSNSPNRHSYLLYSAGPDGIDAGNGWESGDDLRNW